MTIYTLIKALINVSPMIEYELILSNDYIIRNYSTTKLDSSLMQIFHTNNDNSTVGCYNEICTLHYNYRESGIQDNYYVYHDQFANQFPNLRFYERLISLENKEYEIPTNIGNMTDEDKFKFMLTNCNAIYNIIDFNSVILNDPMYDNFLYIEFSGDKEVNFDQFENIIKLIYEKLK